jgi:hypothetical protein
MITSLPKSWSPEGINVEIYKHKITFNERGTTPFLRDTELTKWYKICYILIVVGSFKNKRLQIKNGNINPPKIERINYETRN